MANPDRVIVEVVIAAPFDRVWKALREPARIREWFGWDYAGLTDEIEAFFVAGGLVESEGVLRLTGCSDRFELEDRDGHTVVRVIRSDPAESWDDVYDDIAEGWMTFAHQLKFALERHEGQERQTIYLSGRSRQASDKPPIAALGLETATGRTTLALPGGDGLDGHVLFRSRYQIGLLIPAWGNGLIAVADRPTTASSPHGGGFAILTPYGLDASRYAELRHQWAQWWRTQYEKVTVQPGDDSEA